MTRVTLVLVVAMLAGCAGMTTEQRERRGYRNADWANRFVDFRVRCHAAGGRVLIVSSSRMGADGIPGRGDYYTCSRRLDEAWSTASRWRVPARSLWQ